MRLNKKYSWKKQWILSWILTLSLLPLGCQKEDATHSNDESNSSTSETIGINSTGRDTVAAGVQTTVVSTTTDTKTATNTKTSTDTSTQTSTSTATATPVAPVVKRPTDKDFDVSGLFLVSTDGLNVSAAVENRSFQVALRVVGKKGFPPPEGTDVTFAATVGKAVPGLVKTNDEGIATTTIFIGSDAVPHGDAFVTASFNNPLNGVLLQKSSRVFLSGPVKRFNITHLYNPTNDPTTETVFPEKFGFFLVEVADAFGNSLSDGSTLKCQIRHIPPNSGGDGQMIETAAVYSNDAPQALSLYPLGQDLELIQFDKLTTPGPGKTQFTFHVPSNELEFFKSTSRTFLKSVTCDLSTLNSVASSVAESGHLVSSDVTTSPGIRTPQTLSKTLFLEVAGPDVGDNEAVQGSMSLAVLLNSKYGYNAPFFGHSGMEISLGLQLSDQRGNPVKPGTAIYLSTTSGSVDEVVRTNNTGSAVAILRSGFPLPDAFYTALFGLNPGEVRVSARTTRSDKIEVTTNATVLWSGSIGKLCFIPGDNFLSTKLLIEDFQGNPLSEGTHLKCEGVLQKTQITQTTNTKGETVNQSTDSEEIIQSSIEDMTFTSMSLRTTSEAQRVGLSGEPQAGITSFNVFLPPDKEKDTALLISRFQKIQCELITENGSVGKALTYKISVTRDNRGNICR